MNDKKQERKEGTVRKIQLLIKNKTIFRTNRFVGFVAALPGSPTPDVDARLLISPSTLLRGRNCIPWFSLLMISEGTATVLV